MAGDGGINNIMDLQLMLSFISIETTSRVPGSDWYLNFSGQEWQQPPPTHTHNMHSQIYTNMISLEQFGLTATGGTAVLPLRIQSSCLSADHPCRSETITAVVVAAVSQANQLGTTYLPWTGCSSICFLPLITCFSACVLPHSTNIPPIRE